MDGYRVAFDLAQTPSRLTDALMVPSLLTAIGIILVVVPQRYLDRIFVFGPKGKLGKAFGIVYLLFAGSITILVGSGRVSDYFEFTQMENSGRLNTVSGCISGFHPMPSEGHEDEVVQVGGKKFSYSDFDETSPSFNKTEALGGPIHPDSRLKIFYTGNNIVRLEVQDHTCPKAPLLPKAADE